jgi:cysteine desulfuration protein SufE
MLSTGEIIESFELLDDWDTRYAYLVELGEALPSMDNSLKTEENRVQGCVSRVWVHARLDSELPGRVVKYVGDSDTAIIKGVLALLIELMSGRSPTEIANLDVDSLFDELRLAENLSPNRHFGIYAIVDIMKRQSEALSKRASSATISIS